MTSPTDSAFPWIATPIGQGHRGESGLTIRQYYFGQAMANSAICHSGMTHQERAIQALRQADAMIATEGMMEI